MRSRSSRSGRPVKAIGLLAASSLLAGALTTIPVLPASAAPNADLAYPVFSGLKNPVPDQGTGYTNGNMLKAIFDADVAKGAGKVGGPDFWMDRMLVREGTGPTSNETDANQYLFSRGRAVFMKAHDPSVLGFGGEVAYWESINGKGAYAITLSVDGKDLTLTEDGSARKQTPSYWQSTFTTDNAAITVVETKFITNANVAVTSLTIRNSGSATTVAVKATSPYATVTTGDELTGTVPALNNLTTLYPRFSGDGMTVADGSLTGTVQVPASSSAQTKVQLGFVTPEIADSRSEYDTFRQATPNAAYSDQVTAYNRWWVDNVPYLDVPDENVDKSLYYRWWLMRFNYLDANIPGNDYQFPTSVEGALGYNNAIDLTVPLFIDDLKYFRNSAYSYGPAISAGEVAGRGKYKDNPGDPANWSTSHAQYISAAAWRAYQLHGGPASVAAKLARYAEDDVKGELKDYDANDNGVLEINNTAWTGNDADAVSYDYKPGSTLERPETAFTWAGADAARQAYELAGDTAGAARAKALADKIKKGMIATLWDPTTKDILSRIAGGTNDGVRVPWREINNYDAFAVGMMPKAGDADYSADYVQALRNFADADQFPIFPFYTANQADKKEAAAAGHPGSNNFSVINSTGLMNTMSAAIRHYPSSAITAESLKKLIFWNAYAVYQNNGDNRYPDANEFWAAGSASPQAIGYRSWIHHTILGATNHTVIEDVMGLQSRDDDKVELWPIDMDLDHFAANNLRYRNTDMSITWVKPGTVSPYGADVPEGYTLWIDGKRAVTLDSLQHFVYDPTTGDVDLQGGSATVAYNAKSVVEAPTAVSIDPDSRTADILAKVGVDVTDKTGADLAAGATVTATTTASGTSTAAVVDGSTTLSPLWSNAGSSTATDTLTLKLSKEQSVNDVKIFYYSDKLAKGLREPALQTVQYNDGGTWKDVPGLASSPTYPLANLNDVRFADVTTDQLRVTVRPQPGYRTGIKEIQVFHADGSVDPAGNAAPSVQAYVDTATSSGGQATLIGVVKDDGAPSGTLTQKWSVESAPADGVVVFSDPNAPSTTARFSTAGRYTVRLTATDGAKAGTQDVVVEAGDPSASSNIAQSATPTASYTAGWNDVTAVNNGAAGNTGGEQKGVWGTWSGDRPATQWLQYTWANAVRLSGSDITFWHDSPAGGNGVAVPKSWKLQYLAADGTTWVDVTNPSGFGVNDTGSNATTFDAVTTKSVRATFNAATDGTTYAGMAVSEWKVLADSPVSIGQTHVRTQTGTVPALPSQVEVVYADHSRSLAAVTWPEVTTDQVSTDGANVVVTGILTGSGLPAKATIYVRSQLGNAITVVDPVAVTTTVKQAPQLPANVVVTYNDGSRDSQIPVTWASVPATSYATVGQFSVTGTVPGTALTATATVEVVKAGSSTVDTTPPVVTLSANPSAPSGSNGWYTGPVTVTVAATDDTDPAPAVQVKVDGGDWATATAPLLFSTDGAHTLVARASDVTGNRSAETTWTANIDATQPVSNADFDATTRRVTVRAADNTSRLASIAYAVNGGAWTAYSAPIQLGSGLTTVTYRATDKAGNVETTNSLVAPKAGVVLVTTATKATVSPTTIEVGDKLKVVATVTPGNVSVATGTIRVRVGSVELGRGALSGGRATLSVATGSLKPGRNTVTVDYLGDALRSASSTSAVVTVKKATTTTTASLSAAKVKKGKAITVSIGVSAPGLSVGGEATVTSGSTTLGTVTVSGGRAKLTISTKKLAAKKHTLTVRFLGGTTTAASSTTVRLTVR